jgi:O-antigen/teichoic acid export membrane protein
MNADTAPAKPPSGRRLRAIRRDARGSEQVMVRDGLSLTIGAGVTSLVGVLAWVVAARLLPREQVGHASAFVSGFLLVAGLGDLGLGAALMRWVPRAGPHRSTLILRCYGVVLLGSCVAAAVVLLLPTGNEILSAIPHFGVTVFLFASVSWALFQFQDSVLVSLGRARWVPYENTSIGLARVGILVAVGPLLGTAGILLSWVAPAVGGVAVVSILVHHVLTRESLPDAPDRIVVMPDRREVFRLLAPTYPAKVCGGLLSDLIPLVVTARFGPAYGAVFFLVWMAGNTVDYTALSFVQSMVVRLSHEPNRTRELFGSGARKMAVLFVPGLLLGAALAEPLLSVFGSAYAEVGANLLRLVLLGCIPRLLTTLVVALSMAHGRGKVVGMLEAGSALGVIGVVGLAPQGNLVLTGFGFVLVQLLVAGGAAVAAIRQLTGDSAQLAGEPSQG